MPDLGAGPFEQWCHYVIVLSQPRYDLFDEEILQNNHINIKQK